jgi:hypothetical protein
MELYGSWKAIPAWASATAAEAQGPAGKDPPVEIKKSKSRAGAGPGGERLGPSAALFARAVLGAHFSQILHARWRAGHHRLNFLLGVLTSQHPESRVHSE